MEYNLNKIIAIKCYEKLRGTKFHLSKKGTYWWKFLGIIPIFKYTQKEDLYKPAFAFNDPWVTKEEFIESFSKKFWKENYFDIDGNIYSNPRVVMWVTGDYYIGNSNYASIIKFFDTVEQMKEYKNQFIEDCQSKGIYFKEL